MVTTIPGVSGTGDRLTQHLAHRPVTFVKTWLPWRSVSGLRTSTDKQHNRDNLLKIKKSDLQSWKLRALSSAQLSEPLMTQQLLHTLRVLPGNHHGSLFPNTLRAPCFLCQASVSPIPWLRVCAPKLAPFWRCFVCPHSQVPVLRHPPETALTPPWEKEEGCFSSHTAGGSGVRTDSRSSFLPSSLFPGLLYNVTL